MTLPLCNIMFSACS